MLTLNDGRSELWQWDTGRKLTVDADCSQVHFSNKVFGRSIDVDVVDGVAIIPDILLQTDKDLTAWAFVGAPKNGYTKISKVFKVNKRNKPADYVFTPTEQTTLGELIERLDKIEESQDPDAIKNAVDDYLANNPIEIDETDPTVPEWAKQPTKPSYTASEVGALSADTVIPTIPDNVSAFRNDAGYLTEHQDLTGYATERYVQGYAQPKGDYLTAIPDGYAKIEDIPTKPGDIGAQPAGNYLTEVPSGYATEEFVKNKIAEAELGGEEVDLSGYAQKSELPTKVSQLENDKGYLTEHQDISGKLDASALPTAINTALAQAKASGEFDGKDGVDGKDGQDGYTPQKGVDYFDGQPGKDGVDGKDGSPGADGSPGKDGVSATHSWNGTTLTITSASGTSSANLKGEKGDRGEQGIQGEKGDKGDKGEAGAAGAAGKDGTSVTVKSVSESTEDGGSNMVVFSDGKTLTIKNGSKGSKGDPGETPVKGTDYFTDADKQEIAEMAAELIPGFVSTFAELKAATLNNVTPIVLVAGVTIEATEMLTFQAGTTLIGNGATIKRASGHENKLLYLHRNCRVQDLVIDGNRSAMVSPTWDKTIEVSTSSGCVVDNVTINDGNEAILVFGDNCVITNCNINNCGGNGIHFTGSNNTLVENCRVINANLRTDGSMGHEDGCIIWSNECDHIVCSNNWCEGGIAGFGSIDAAFNSHVKLIGNTVKGCTVAIDLRYQAKAPHDIVISGNTFIDSGKIDLNKENSQIYVPGNISVNGNLFINTDASFFHVTDVAMVGNIFKNGCPSFTRCARVTIANNTVNNARDTAKNGIFSNKCLNVVVEGNYVRAHKDVLNVGYSTGAIVRNNNIRNVYSPSNTDYCINCNSVKNLLFDGNIVVLYRKGMNIPSYAHITNNTILCVNSGFNALMLSDRTTNVLIRGNRISGSKTFSTASTTNVVEGNDIGAYDDVFVNVTQTLTNLTSDAPTKATKGDEFAFTITPNEGSTLPDTIAITNNGVAMDVNEYEYDNTTGAVLIHCVIGDVAITAETEGTGPAYTNLVPTSIDTDGTVYNGIGYMNGKRLSSSGAVKDLSTSSVTGFIKAKAGDVVRLSGVVLAGDPSNCYIAAYNSSFTLVGAKTVSGSIYGTDPATIVWDGTICTYTLANVSNIAYIRINAVCDDGPNGADMIVTVNEEIT